MSGALSRIVAWSKRQMPKREELEHNRWVGPFARRPELWRFTRRSVPRGVAVGLLVGIFALIPGIQIIGAAMMCVPCRGNIPIAALMTFLSMPLTTPLILLGSAWVGNGLGFHVDLATVQQMMDQHASLREWVYWFLSDAAPGVVTGLFIISVIAASVGYVVSAVLWTWWVRRKRHRLMDKLRAERRGV
jgi:uncharacterized protein (DUF2062 family)